MKNIIASSCLSPAIDMLGHRAPVVTLARSHFADLAANRSYVDHRASEAQLLIAYSAGGALPDPAASPVSRQTPLDKLLDKLNTPVTTDPLPARVMRGAVCRIVKQELELTAELLARPSGTRPSSTGDDDHDPLHVAPERLCDHMEARGQLGHTELRVRSTRKVCDELIRRHGDDLADVLSAFARQSSRKALDLGDVLTDCRDDSVELPGWPAALQFLLDQDDAPLSSSLGEPDGEAATALSTAGTGAAAGLLLLATARSDTLMIKHLCAFGVCRRALEEGASPTALASALASSTPLVDPDSSDTDAPTRAELARTLRRFLLHLRWDDEPSGVDSDGLCQAGVDGTQPSDSTCTAHSGTTPAPASNQPHRHPDGLSSANSWRSHLSPLHIAAYLLDAEALAAMLRRAPSQHLVDVKDDRGRTPLHYAVHAAERHKGLVYLFTPQPFRTWLASHSKSRLRFAPPLTRLNVTRELYGVQYETVTALLHAKASPTVADDSGHTPIHIGAASGLDASLLHALGEAAAQEVGGQTQGRGGAGSAEAAMRSTLMMRDRWGRTGIDLATAAGFDSNALLSSSPETPTREDTEQKTSARCGIDELDADAITPAEIHQKYILRGRPFALRNATRGWPAETLLTREAFHDSFGAATWTPQLLLPGRPTELSPYLKRAASGELTRPIAFNRPSDPNLLHALRALVQWPHAIPSPGQPPEPDEGGGAGRSGASGRTGLDFFVGSNGSGTPLHHHSAVWNALIYGRKLWALVPPSRAAFGPRGEHPLDSEWWQVWQSHGGGAFPSSAQHSSAGKKGSRKKKGKRRTAPTFVFCEQDAGTLLYVPTQWSHATLNMEESLGVGGFLQDDSGLGMHMQLLHAPRGIGSLQNAAIIHEDWFRTVGRAFPHDS